MSYNKLRRPLAHFFVKKSIQVKIIINILLVVSFTTLITTIGMIAVYNQKAKGGNFYYMSNDFQKDIELTNILGVILPSLLIAQIISIAIGLWIGLFSSRKVGVTVYKLEKWINQLKEGKLNTTIAFRENEEGEMEELTNECNGLTQSLRNIFIDIHAKVDSIEQEKNLPPSALRQLSEIKDILKKFSYSE